VIDFRAALAALTSNGVQFIIVGERPPPPTAPPA